MARLFNVLDLEYNELLRDGDDYHVLERGDRRWSSSPRVFASANEAAVMANVLTQMGRKFQPRPVKMEGDAWKTREVERLFSGEYEPLPWDGLRPQDFLGLNRFRHEWTISMRVKEAEFHYPHMSGKVKGNIAFTENADRGAHDVQTTMKPGKYLKKFYPSIGEENIRRYANEIIAKYGTCVFALAQTPDEIVQVYLNGPTSCMTLSAGSYSTNGVHPVRAYGAGDLAVAYLMVQPNKGQDEENDEPATDFIGPICSRALVWPEMKLHGRIYGDTQKMVHFLRENGYTESEGWDFSGARLLHIPVPRRSGWVVCPYIDGDQRMLRYDKTRDVLVLDENGYINGETTTGCAELHSTPEYTCSECGDCLTDDPNGPDGYRVMARPHGTRLRLCEYCVGDNLFYCEYSRQEFFDTDNETTVDGQSWHVYYRDRNAFRSARDGMYHRNSTRITMGNGEYWTLVEVEDYGEPSATGQVWPRDEMITCADGQRRHPSETSEAVPAAVVNDERGVQNNG